MLQESMANPLVHPPQFLKDLGVPHVKGMLLYGPPGCGKTLIARQLSKALKSRPPKTVAGPEIFDKMVGESERKIRELFAEAEVRLFFIYLFIQVFRGVLYLSFKFSGWLDTSHQPVAESIHLPTNNPLTLNPKP